MRSVEKGSLGADARSRSVERWSSVSTTLVAGTKPLAGLTRFEQLEEPAPAVAPRRLLSLDVFRGITIAAMLLVNNGPGTPYAPLEHAEWHGWTVTDLIFPFFLFIVGVAIPLSLIRRGASEHLTVGQQVARIWTRALSLILLGVLLAANNLVWPFTNTPGGFPLASGLRMFGFVFVYGSIFFLLTPWPWKSVSRWMPVAIAVLLAGYLVTMHFVREGAIANGWPSDAFGAGAFNPDMLRLPGVLQRIGICYGVAAMIALLFQWRGVLLFALLFCAVYSVLMLQGRFPGADDATRGSLTKEVNFARAVDEFVFDRKTVAEDGTASYSYRHAYRDYPDNEGIVSTLPAIATALIGVLVGFWLLTQRSKSELAAGLLATGLLVALLGLLLDHALMPINKALWTPSFTVFTAGMGMLCLGFVFWLIEVCGRRAWAWPFKVIGMNAIAAFVLANLLVRVGRLIVVTDPGVNKDGRPIGDVALLTYLNNRIIAGTHAASDFWTSLSAHLPALDTPQNLSLAYALAIVLIVWLITWVMYLCRVFVKV